MSTTLATIRADFIKEYGMGRAGTATSASTTTLVDAVNFGGDEPRGQFPNGSPVRITSGAAINLKSRLRALDPSTGTLTINPAATGNTGTPTFVVSKDVDSIDRFDEALNRALLRRCTRWLPVPLTDVPDGDFLGGTITDFWTPIATTTQAYTSLTMLNGILQRVLQVTAGAATNRYTESLSVPVRPLEVRQGFITMRAAAASSTAELVVRDLSNTAVITPTFSLNGATSTSRSFINVRYTYTVPAGCTQVSYRLQVQEASGVAQFGCLIDVGQDQHLFANQAYAKGWNDIGAFSKLNISSGSTSRFNENFFTPLDEDSLGLRDFGWGTGIEFDFTPPFGTHYDALLFYPALTADTDATDCPEELAIAGMAYELFTMLESGEIKQVETGGASRWTILLARAEATWKSRRIQRLLAQRRVKVHRTYLPAVSA